jgi:hypothetical protein
MFICASVLGAVPSAATLCFTFHRRRENNPPEFPQLKSQPTPDIRANKVTEVMEQAGLNAYI